MRVSGIKWLLDNMPFFCCQVYNLPVHVDSVFVLQNRNTEINNKTQCVSHNVYSCIETYLYSCLHPLSNERKSMFKSGESRAV